jgi:hypothetical protein
LGKGKKPINPSWPRRSGRKAGEHQRRLADLRQSLRRPAPKSAIWLDEMRVSSSGNVPGVDTGLAELMQIPMEIKPGGGMSMADYRNAVERLPNRLQGGLQGALVRYNQLQLTHPGAPAHAMVVADQAKPKDSSVFLRGQPNTKGDVVPRRFLEILSPGGKAEPFKIGSGRYELAKAIVEPEQPAHRSRGGESGLDASLRRRICAYAREISAR